MGDSDDSDPPANLLVDASGERMIKRYQDVPLIIGYKYWKSHMSITIVINSLVNIVYTLTSLIYTFSLLQELLS